MWRQQDADKVIDRTMDAFNRLDNLLDDACIQKVSANIVDTAIDSLADLTASKLRWRWLMAPTA